ncbi:hypothetical protein B0J13DRAFT_646358 [Dactylonectria estremocensis]|uniref:Uncharacterized protein n=1 Tax=Dactylonectria estremocensis TaxID=1079267 RepID=A0A9P9DXJ7_9HYPO|nr:hypothetical protein B0J13DRAFT_646358 [Dactylonectria estremocensis]
MCEDLEEAVAKDGQTTPPWLFPDAILEADGTLSDGHTMEGFLVRHHHGREGKMGGAAPETDFLLRRHGWWLFTCSLGRLGVAMGASRVSVEAASHSLEPARRIPLRQLLASVGREGTRAAAWRWSIVCCVCCVSRVPVDLDQFGHQGETGAESVDTASHLCTLQYHLMLSDSPCKGQAAQEQNKAMGRWRYRRLDVDETRPVGLAMGPACAFDRHSQTFQRAPGGCNIQRRSKTDNKLSIRPAGSPVFELARIFFLSPSFSKHFSFLSWSGHHLSAYPIKKLPPVDTTPPTPTNPRVELRIRTTTPKDHDYDCDDETKRILGQAVGAVPTKPLSLHLLYCYSPITGSNHHDSESKTPINLAETRHFHQVIQSWSLEHLNPTCGIQPIRPVRCHPLTPATTPLTCFSYLWCLSLRLSVTLESHASRAPQPGAATKTHPSLHHPTPRSESSCIVAHPPASGASIRPSFRSPERPLAFSQPRPQSSISTSQTRASPPLHSSVLDSCRHLPGILVKGLVCPHRGSSLSSALLLLLLCLSLCPVVPVPRAPPQNERPHSIAPRVKTQGSRPAQHQDPRDRPGTANPTPSPYPHGSHLPNYWVPAQSPRQRRNSQHTPKTPFGPRCHTKPLRFHTTVP